MAIIEIHENKVEELHECSEKLLKHAAKLMKHIEELKEDSYMEKYGRKRRYDEDEYRRY